MSDVAIRVEGLGKRYRIGGQREPYGTLRDSLASAVRAPLRRLRRGSDERSEFWALRDVSFEVRRGEVLGIIGRNGAGKSTLLKILSRITEPTTGRAALRGRVSSLLEVGTGFHPELSGRENIYLNGAILGMTRRDIQRRFDEIVDFAGIEQFLDTPVKRYSSGMYTRLAFSVAAHLEPEILIVDEVLSVGDLEFQNKSLGKMEEVAGEGRTALFVSHTMSAVQQLCAHCLLLDNGTVWLYDTTPHVLYIYRNQSAATAVTERVWASSTSAPGDNVVRIKAIRVRDGEDTVERPVDIRHSVHIQVEYWNLSSAYKPSVGLHLWTEAGTHLFATHDFNNSMWATSPRSQGRVTSTCSIPGNFLAEGRFFVTVTISSFTPLLLHHFVQPNAVSFEIVDRTNGDGVRGPARGEWPGVLRPMLEWRIEAESGPNEILTV